MALSKDPKKGLTGSERGTVDVGPLLEVKIPKLEVMFLGPTGTGRGSLAHYCATGKVSPLEAKQPVPEYYEVPYVGRCGRSLTLSILVAQGEKEFARLRQTFFQSVHIFVFLFQPSEGDIQSLIEKSDSHNLKSPYMTELQVYECDWREKPSKFFKKQCFVPVVAFTKTDLLSEASAERLWMALQTDSPFYVQQVPCTKPICTSSKTGEGVPQLLDCIVKTYSEFLETSPASDTKCQLQ